MLHKIITCTGYGNTGSSAATNYFEEFNNINSVGSSSFECTFLFENDGIDDLGHFLIEGNRLKVDMAFKRFQKYMKSFGTKYNIYFNNKFCDYLDEYILELKCLCWNGGWHRIFEVDNKDYIKRHDYDYARFLYNKESKKFKYSLYEQDSWRPGYVPNNKMYYNRISEDNFICITKRFLEKLFNEVSTGSEYILLDQLFPHSNPQKYLKYFDFAKVVIIDRDPRDLYFCNKVFWGSRYIPTDDVNIFIDWYKKTRQDKFDNKNENILFIKFEDLIFNYDETTEKLNKLVGLDEENHINKRKIFIPELSINNTRLWEKTIIEDNIIQKKLQSEIIIIENELKEFCFDYSKEQQISENEKHSVNFIFEEVLHKVDKVVDNRNYSISFLMFITVKIFKKLWRIPLKILKH